MKIAPDQKFFSFLFSNEKRTLAFILLLCLVVRMGFFLAVQPWKPEVMENVILKDDASGYHELAIGLLKSHQFGVNNEPEALRTPGYPFFIASLYVLFGIRPWVVLLFQIIIEVFSCFFLYQILSRILNPKVALISCLFYALDPFLILHSCILYIDILFVFFLILGFSFFCYGFFKRNRKSAFPFYGLYAVVKLYAYWITKNYREACGVFAVNGILFNHESPRRGETFVTRKITRTVARIVLGLQDKLVLGNLDAKRDWGYAPEYCEGMWRMLQLDEPEDFVLATGETHSVREFCELAFREVDIELEWQGTAENERGIVKALNKEKVESIKEKVSKTTFNFRLFPFSFGDTLVSVSLSYYRPTEVDILMGNP